MRRDKAESVAKQLLDDSIVLQPSLSTYDETVAEMADYIQSAFLEGSAMTNTYHCTCACHKEADRCEQCCNGRLSR